MGIRDQIVLATATQILSFSINLSDPERLKYGRLRKLAFRRCDKNGDRHVVPRACF